MGDVVRLHADTGGKRSGRRAETGIPVLSETEGTSLPSIFRAPVSHLVMVGRDTPSVTANSSCESPWSSRYLVRAEIALMPPSVPSWNSTCQAESVRLVRDMIVPTRYGAGMVTTGRPRGYLWIEERMADLGLDDAALAKRCGVERVTVLRWRDPAEQHRINPQKMVTIATALECDEPADLFLPPGHVTVVLNAAGKIAKKTG